LGRKQAEICCIRFIIDFKKKIQRDTLTRISAPVMELKKKQKQASFSLGIASFKLQFTDFLEVVENCFLIKAPLGEPFSNLILIFAPRIYKE